MALSDIIFIKGEGGLGRPLTGEDHISGFVAYIANANLPAGFTTTDRIKQVFSLSQAESLGIAKGGTYTDVIWYHISEYFRLQPDGQLYIGLFDSASIDYSVVKTVQNFADGKIRQIGVFDETAFTTATVGTLQTHATTLETEHKPVQILYSGNIAGVSDLSTLSDLTTLTAKNVSVVIGEDGSGYGSTLAASKGYSITCLGAILGAVSLAKVHEHIGWVAKFNLTDGTELNVPAFGNQTKVKDVATSLLTAIDNKGYLFVRKHIGNAGSFVEDTPTCVVATSDYSTIENNRTIDKAVRGVRAFMLPNLNAPLYVDANGKLSEDTIAFFKNDADRALEQMQVDGELSQYKVLIDPTQNVLSTSKLVVTIKIVPVGVARQIEINIGFTVNI